MSEHLPLGSRGGSPLPFHRLQETSHPRPHGNPDPLASVWIRRLHLTPNPPPQASLAPPPPQQGYDAVSSRSAGFGPLRWSPRPPPFAAWDAAHVPSGSGSGPPMLSPFFRFPPPPLPGVADVGGFAPIRPTIGFGSSGGGFPELSSRAIVGDNPHASWLATAAAGLFCQHQVEHIQDELILFSSAVIVHRLPVVI
ncbi:hypothetical protein BRADI_1g12170v3 [Brachypodium distachyon]|uniref:Uncharacterized protein n=1 Tax=Brachypodium distachyon TaxID=15368 RepID=A0A0Q3RLE9_BRADI|nr:hypothetical protein BRADI_1g12170v3 [Brachypodium distachyon]